MTPISALRLPHSRTPRQRQHGVALLTVLLLVAVMAVLVTSVLDDIRFGLRRASNAQSMAQARWHALGAETLARARIEQLARALFPVPTARWNGQPMMFPTERGVIHARLADASTCFNLNSVVQGAGDLWQRREPGARQFGALLRALDVPAHRSAALVDALVDWIDTDTVPSANGAEDDHYAVRAPGYRTAGIPLAEPSEMRAVAGFDAPLYAKLRPHICALPTDDLSPINLNALHPDQAVLLVMLSDGALSEGAARRLLTARPDAGWPDLDAVRAEPVLAALDLPDAMFDQIELQPRFFALETRVEHGGAQFVSSALFELAAGHARLVARRWTLPE
jgi:general secretion pathway protein K